MAAATELKATNARIYGLITGVQAVTDFVGTHPEFQDTYNVWFNKAPEGSRLPYVVFTFLGGSTRSVGSGKPSFKKLKYSVAIVVASDSLSAAYDVLAEIEPLFYRDQVTGNDTVIAGSRVNQNFAYSDVLNGGVHVQRVGFTVEIMTYAQI